MQISCIRSWVVLDKRDGHREKEKRNRGRTSDQVMTVGRKMPQQIYNARIRRKIKMCPDVSRRTKEIEVFNACGFLSNHVTDNPRNSTMSSKVNKTYFEKKKMSSVGCHTVYYRLFCRLFGETYRFIIVGTESVSSSTCTKYNHPESKDSIIVWNVGNKLIVLNVVEAMKTVAWRTLSLRTRRLVQKWH